MLNLGLLALFVRFRLFATVEQSLWTVLLFGCSSLRLLVCVGLADWLAAGASEPTGESLRLMKPVGFEIFQIYQSADLI